MTILLMKDRTSKALRAWPLKNKGISTDEPADLALEGITDLGYQHKIHIKVDNERPLVALREEIRKRAPVQMQVVEVPVGESQSNGCTENGVKLFKGLLRVLLLAFEARIGGKIGSEHPVLTWLVQHTANVATKYLVSSDGKTL